MSSQGHASFVMDDGVHFYLSTACMHLLHQRCRETCKFCTASCVCRCHLDEPLIAVPE